MLLEIRGHDLPGRHWLVDNEPCDNVHVGVQVAREPCELVRADAVSAAWTVPIAVVERDGHHDFQGPAVHGKRGARFIYLTWGNIDKDGTFTMFRRAKLMMADLEPDFVGKSHVVATVHLTDERGGPRCARLCPPALKLSVALAEPD